VGKRPSHRTRGVATFTTLSIRKVVSMKNKAFCTLVLAVALCLGGIAKIGATEASEARSIAFLGVHFQNDNAGFEPTSEAERARMKKIEDLFKSDLANTQKLRFVDVPAGVQEKMAHGQAIGACSGCEIDYGKELNAQLVAWIDIQKVSNLILNMNVYIADVSTGQFVFKRSVDIRGNTDESWTRSLTFLMKRYLLPAFA
jgi:hypothetical protein